MKILITGATGNIGRGVLAACRAHPAITSVVSFSRRPLPLEVSRHAKLECIVMPDFKQWPDTVLQTHADAGAMICLLEPFPPFLTSILPSRHLTRVDRAIVTYDGNSAANLEYPLAFCEALGRVLLARPSRASKFRYILLGGRWTEPDQTKDLYWMTEARKVRVGTPGPSRLAPKTRH